jgi:hypothetical protein
MAGDEAVLDADRDGKDDYHRRLAAEVVAMLPYRRNDGRTVLKLVEQISRNYSRAKSQPRGGRAAGAMTAPPVPCWPVGGLLHRPAGSSRSIN